MFNMSQLWLELTKGTYMVAMPLIAGQRQEVLSSRLAWFTHSKFQASQGYIARHCLKN